MDEFKDPAEFQPFADPEPEQSGDWTKDVDFDWDYTDLDTELVRARRGLATLWVCEDWNRVHAVLSETFEDPGFEGEFFYFDTGKGTVYVTSADNANLFESIDRVVIDPDSRRIRIDPFKGVLTKAEKVIISLGEDEEARVYGSGFDYDHGEVPAW